MRVLLIAAAVFAAVQAFRKSAGVIPSSTL